MTAVSCAHSQTRRKKKNADGWQTLRNKFSAQGQHKDPGCFEGHGTGDMSTLAYTKCLKLLFASAAESIQHTCSWSNAAIPSQRQSHPFNPLETNAYITTWLQTNCSCYNYTLWNVCVCTRRTPCYYYACTKAQATGSQRLHQLWVWQRIYWVVYKGQHASYIHSDPQTLWDNGHCCIM